MPGFYVQNEYDIAGFAVGVVEKNKLLPKNTITEGDKVIYLPSSGIHSNGFSLVRKIMDDLDLSYSDKAAFSVDGKTFGMYIVIKATSRQFSEYSTKIILPFQKSYS